MFSFLKRRAAPSIIVSPATYDEIAQKLGAVLAEPIDDRGAINLGDVILVCGPEPAPDTLAGHRPLSTAGVVKVRARG